MNVATMRKIDRWLGVPVCAALTLIRRLTDWTRKSPPAKVGKILLVKLAEQGSTVLAAGAIERAVKMVGRQNVYFLVFQENRFILDVMDMISPANVLAIPTGGLRTVARGAIAKLREARRLGIDAAIDLEFFARSSAALTYLSGASRRVGYHSYFGEASYRGDLMTHRLSFNSQLHAAEAFETMVAALDQPGQSLPTFPITPDGLGRKSVTFAPSAQESAEVRQLLARLAGRRDVKSLVLLNPNCSDLLPLRSWPKQRYADLAQKLLAAHPKMFVAFTGAPNEAAAAAELAAAVGSDRVINLAGQTTLRQLLVAYTLADVLVTNDSGPAHFASLANLDVVVLFGPESPRLFAARTDRTHVLYSHIVCSPCVNAFNDRQSACQNNLCMQNISVEEVFQAVEKVCQERRK